MSNQSPVTFHDEDEDFVMETKDGFLVKGVYLKSFELLFIAQWVDENRDEIENMAENDLDVAKDRLLQELYSMLREKYEVTRTDKEVQVIPEAWRHDPEHPSESEAVAFPYTIGALKEYIRFQGGEID